MARINLSLYTVEYVHYFGYGYKTHTWFVSRKNYNRDGFYNSDTVWVFTTDDIGIYNRLHLSGISKESLIRLIKSFPSTKMYNASIF